MVLNGANNCVKAMYKALCGSMFYGNYIHSDNILKNNSIDTNFILLSRFSKIIVHFLLPI